MSTPDSGDRAVPLPDALVGATGLVGGTLLRRRAFSVQVASATADTMHGRSFGTVVFSAARAEKWRANADPVADRRHVDDLCRLLDTFEARRLVLVSTVDVFSAPRGVDESSETPAAGLTAYGRHRLALEQHALGSFERVHVVRLPGLFGRGLKKNVVHDLLHGHELSRLDPTSVYQYYDLEHLADDVDAVVNADLGLAHLVTEPVSTDTVATAVFGVRLPPVQPAGTRAQYDVHTRHAGLLGGAGRYLHDAATVLQQLTAFVRAERTAFS